MMLIMHNGIVNFAYDLRLNSTILIIFNVNSFIIKTYFFYEDINRELTIVRGGGVDMIWRTQVSYEELHPTSV